MVYTITNYLYLIYLFYIGQQNKKKARNIYQTNATFIVAFTEQLLFIVKK